MKEPSPWFGQPRGLTVLFLTNMWEQFSYYGMRALLVYYMTKQLMLGQGTSSFVYGAYTACAYFTPIVGGVVADRLLGKRRAIIIGASIMAAGHLMMTFEGLFYAALVTIALGNGLFLPSLPSQIDRLYKPDDPRRPWAYNLYYVGINVGGFLAPLICGSIGELYGWHYGFGVAGIGMLAGLLIYISGQRYLPAEPVPTRIAAVARQSARMDKRIVLLLVGVALSVTVFRSAYEQVGNTVALWTEVGVDRRAGSLLIPMTWFQSLNSLFVIVFTQPLLSAWRQRAAAGHEQRLARRMALGALIVAGAYVLLAAVAWRDGSVRAGWPWLVAFFAILTFGELFILPTGLGVFAKLAPPGLGATTVAAWFLTIFSGSLSAGFIGMLWGRIGHAAFFVLLALLATIAALLLRLLETPMHRLSKPAEEHQLRLEGECP
jgi:POT family proton-dependent oligopeptide transporter